MQGGAPNTLALRRPVPVTPAMLTPPGRAVTPATSEDGPARCRAGSGYAKLDLFGGIPTPDAATFAVKS